MLKPLIRRQFFWTLVIFLGVMSCTHFLSRFLMRLDRTDMLQHQLAVYKYMIEKSGSDRIATVNEINAVNVANGAPVRLHLVEEGSPEFKTDRGPGPGGPAGDLLPPPPWAGWFGGPPGIGARGFGPSRSVQLSGDVPTKLILRLGPPPEGRSPMLMSALIFLSLVLASFLSVFFFFWRFREKAEIAKNVLSRMQQGDLKARFPTSRWDDAGQILTLFNQMADEIERLVQSLRDNEKSRMHLLQDLAHDLRTPVASLSNLLEGLDETQGSLDPASRQELTNLATQETEYLTRLVEDLLFLALVIEPKYKEESHEIAIQDLIQSQLVVVANQRPKIKLSPVLNTPAKQNLITGNPHLVTRLVRNALENAASFARSTVEVEVTSSSDVIEIAVRDDGPGFSKEALETFGHKRATRYLSNTDQNSRLSVGLGSVIMQAIARAHGGEVTVRNLTHADGQVAGAEVIIRLAKSFEQALPA